MKNVQQYHTHRKYLSTHIQHDLKMHWFVDKLHLLLDPTKNCCCHPHANTFATIHLSCRTCKTVDCCKYVCIFFVKIHKTTQRKTKQRKTKQRKQNKNKENKRNCMSLSSSAQIEQTVNVQAQTQYAAPFNQLVSQTQALNAAYLTALSSATVASTAIHLQQSATNQAVEQYQTNTQSSIDSARKGYYEYSRYLNLANWYTYVWFWLYITATVLIASMVWSKFGILAAIGALFIMFGYYMGVQWYFSDKLIPNAISKGNLP